MIINLTLDLHEVETKSEMFKKMGLLAEAFDDNDVEIVVFSEQKPAGAIPATKPRKPRGPNKPKTTDVNGPQIIEPVAVKQTAELPEFLKRA